MSVDEIDGFIDSCIDMGLPMEKTAALLDTHLLDVAHKNPDFQKGLAESLAQFPEEIQTKVATFLQDADNRKAWYMHALT